MQGAAAASDAAKDAIVSAVALAGFGELSALLHEAREGAGSPHAELRAVASAYLDFAQANPALYEAMFTLAVDLTFAQPDSQSRLVTAFAEVRGALAPLAGDRDLETLTEITWSALHGLATLSRAGRLRPDYHDQRLAMIVDQRQPAQNVAGQPAAAEFDTSQGHAGLWPDPLRSGRAVNPLVGGDAAGRLMRCRAGIRLAWLPG